jgi:nucleoid DNA-binding protein
VAAAAGLLLFLSLAGVVYSQRVTQPPPRPQTPRYGAGVPLVKRLAARSRLPENTVKAVLDALGPEVVAEIQRGATDTIPGLGTIRIVRVAEHKDMERGTGRPVTIPARNYVIFDPDPTVESAANSANVQPSEVVPAFEYNVMPGQAPSIKAGSTKVRSPRTP